MRPMILDANNFIVRCIMASALGDLQAGGIWTGGVFGSLRSLKHMVEASEMRPDGIIACFDCGVPKRRLALIPNFKEERKLKREMLADEEKEAAMEQLDLCYEAFEYMGITCLRYRDREADDTVAALVRVFAAHDMKPIVVSGDGDLLQTVKMGAEVWNIREKQWYDSDTFYTKLGMLPEYFLLYKALVGDNSDSIDGAIGFGPAKALKLIQDVIVEIDTGSRGGCALCDHSPEGQLDCIISHVEAKTKRSKAEDRLLADRVRLNRELRGIDLSNSWGPLSSLESRLHKEPPPIDRTGFLRFCGRLNLNSMLADHAAFLETFSASRARYVELMVHLDEPPF